MNGRTWRVSDLIAQLEPDRWRIKNPFSADMAACHCVLFASGTSRAEKADVLAAWLGESQPCLFGRMEAKQRRLAFCILTENDLERSDQEIRVRIEQERLLWKRAAFKGETHGFLIVVLSETIARARPGTILHQLAECICELYLAVKESDRIHHDDLVLEIGIDGRRAENRCWKVGVNYFSAQGDRRWWHDHRIPGGLAFSMNSVGHMARTRAELEISKNRDLAARAAEMPREKLVYWALPTAMKTIGPRVAGSDRGTWLVERGAFREDREPPTYEQRQRYFGELARFSENRYKGRYHTDISVPSEYFREELWKLEEIGERDDLFFTYLHRLADEDYRTMGFGEETGLAVDGGLTNQIESGSTQ